MSLYSLAFTGVAPFAALAIARLFDLIGMRRELQLAAVMYGVCQAKYVERILALPDGAPRVWLFWMPVAVAIAGLWALAFFLRRSRLKAAHPLAAGVAPAELDADWDANQASSRLP